MNGHGLGSLTLVVLFASGCARTTRLVEPAASPQPITMHGVIYAAVGIGPQGACFWPRIRSDDGQYLALFPRDPELDRILNRWSSAQHGVTLTGPPDQAWCQPIGSLGAALAVTGYRFDELRQ